MINNKINSAINVVLWRVHCNPISLEKKFVGWPSALPFKRIEPNFGFIDFPGFIHHTNTCMIIRFRIWISNQLQCFSFFETFKRSERNSCRIHQCIFTEMYFLNLFSAYRMTYKGSKVCHVRGLVWAKILPLPASSPLFDFLNSPGIIVHSVDNSKFSIEKRYFRKVQLERVKCVTIVVCAEMNQKSRNSHFKMLS